MNDVPDNKVIFGSPALDRRHFFEIIRGLQKTRPLDMLQQTLKKTVSFEGNALHTGESVKVNLVPDDANTGIVFVRTDLDNSEIPALAKHINRTNRQTILQKGDASVGTVEHLMASCMPWV